MSWIVIVCLNARIDEYPRVSKIIGQKYGVKNKEVFIDATIFFKRVKEFVNESVIKAPVPEKLEKFEQELKETQLRHYKRTVFWIKKLEPNATEALLIAAYAHDIERWFRNPKNARKIDKREHQEKGAKIISNFLNRLSADKTLINKVCYFIRNHETGGTPETNILKDADSISFFENNVQIHAKIFPKRLRKKIEWMYKRITLPKAKIYAKPFYMQAIRFAKSKKLW